MKHLFLTAISALLLGGFTLTSCNDDKEEIGTAVPGTLEVSTTQLDFGTKAETKTFTITTKDEWNIELPRYATWFTVEPMSGKGTTEVKVSVSDLDKGAEYSSYINVSTATNTVNVFVKQKDPNTKD